MEKFEIPCTHDGGCKPPRDATGRCGAQIAHEAHIAASVGINRLLSSKLYFSQDADVVGDVDMTPDERKSSLVPTGKGEIIQLPEEFQNLNDEPQVDQKAVDFWRDAQQRKSEDD